MRIDLPQGVRTIVESICRKEYEAYVVGGCVRDSLLGKDPKDWDICTNALPQEVMNIFEDCLVIPTGLKHGTVTVVQDGVPYEVTTYRTDSEYTDGRHPRRVDFVQNLREDLARRDFTINAMAYSEEEGLQDYFGGQRDLEQKVIRTVGTPEERFSEDYLRMLRAIRFASVLGFSIEEVTFRAIQKQAGSIRRISGERVRDELSKMMGSDHAVDALEKLRKSGLLRYVLPELEACVGCTQHHPCHAKDVYGHILEVLGALEGAEEVVKWAALFHDIGKVWTKSVDEKGIEHFYAHEAKSAAMSRQILRRLRFSNQAIEDIGILVKNHGYLPKIERTAVKRFLRKIGETNVYRLIALQEADRKAHTDGDTYGEYGEALKKMIEDILAMQEAVYLKDLKLTGKDLIEMGYPQGRIIGEIKSALLQHVIEHPQDNEKERLMELAKQWMK